MVRTIILAGGASFALAASGVVMAQTGTTGTSSSATPQAATPPAATAPAAGGGGVTQGATVYDTQGGTVGTIESIQGDYVVLATSKSKFRLPRSSFATGAKGPMIAMTAAQLEQAAPTSPQPSAAASASVKPDVATGKQVTDAQGGAVGTVGDVDAQFATVTLTTGTKVRLPVTAFGAGSEGKLRVAMTAAQLSAAAAASGGSSGG